LRVFNPLLIKPFKPFLNLFLIHIPASCGKGD